MIDPFVFILAMEVHPGVDSDAEKRPISMTSVSVPVYDGHHIDHKKQRYPYCIVWTPIPCLTYVFGIFIGLIGLI